jgi:prevent-host-death family protein
MESKSNTMLIDALTGRTRFGEIMEKAEKEQARFIVSRRGKAKVVIMSVEEYLRRICRESDISGKAGSLENHGPHKVEISMGPAHERKAMTAKARMAP